MSAAERREQQARISSEFEAFQHERQNIAPRLLTDAERCPANLGKRHDFTMKGNDGKRRCWFCCQRKPEVVS